MAKQMQMMLIAITQLMLPMLMMSTQMVAWRCSYNARGTDAHVNHDAHATGSYGQATRRAADDARDAYGARPS